MMKFIKNFRLGRFIWTLFVTYYFINFARNFFDDAAPDRAIIPTVLFFIVTIWLAFEYYFGSPFFQSGLVEMSPIWRGFFALFFYPYVGFCVADYVWFQWGQVRQLYPTLNLIGILVFAIGVLLRLYSLFLLLHLPDNKFVAKGIYRHCRQPRYLATMIQLIGIALALSSYWGLIFALGIGIPLILVEIHYEEKVLAEHFKTEYINYLKNVPRLFPKLKK